jgi:hypothetical protein
MPLDLRRFFHLLARFFMSIPPAPHIPALFPTVIQRSHIVDWSASIRALPDALLCLVESIEFMKSTQSMQHEYLLIRVRHPRSARLAVFMVDRCPSSKLPIGRLIPSQSGGSSSPPPVASDNVTISAGDDERKITVDKHGTSEILSTLTFPSLRPSVLDLSTLLEVVNSHAPFYTLDEYQCYWFAGATFDVIKLEFEATETRNTTGKLERASFRGYSLKKEDTTPALRKEFTAKNALYASQRKESQRAHEAPIVAVSDGRFEYCSSR